VSPDKGKGLKCSGADGRTRTGDLLITNQLLYQLSYVGLRQALRRRAPADNLGSVPHRRPSSVGLRPSRFALV
jgi:hypothetical protein